MFFQISTHSTATPGIPPPPAVLQSRSPECSPRVEPGDFTPCLRPRLHALYAQLFRLTLAPSVLPRLLARSLPVLLLGVASFSSPPKVLYNPKAFFTHAAWLHQSFLHCAIFPTAASRRSLGRVSVPMWLIILSDQLGIVALVGLCPANQLIPPGRIRQRISPFPLGVICGISSRFQLLSPSARQLPRHYSPVRHSPAGSASTPPAAVRLACIRPAASVQSEP